MQLIDQGRLDLHADVNRFLDAFEIPATTRNPDKTLFPDPLPCVSLFPPTCQTSGFGRDTVLSLKVRITAMLPLTASARSASGKSRSTSS
jgi:hypothetical protein